MRQCRSIFQLLKLSPDELETQYVCENNIVDIGYDDDPVTSTAANIVTDDNDVADEDDEEGMLIPLSQDYPKVTQAQTYLLLTYWEITSSQLRRNRPHKLDQFLITMSIDQQTVPIPMFFDGSICAHKGQL